MLLLKKPIKKKKNWREEALSLAFFSVTSLYPLCPVVTFPKIAQSIRIWYYFENSLIKHKNKDMDF